MFKVARKVVSTSFGLTWRAQRSPINEPWLPLGGKDDRGRVIPASFSKKILPIG